MTFLLQMTVLLLLIAVVCLFLSLREIRRELGRAQRKLAHLVEEQIKLEAGVKNAQWPKGSLAAFCDNTVKDQARVAAREALHQRLDALRKDLLDFARAVGWRMDEPTEHVRGWVKVAQPKPAPKPARRR